MGPYGMLAPLPTRFAATRDAVHQLACYAVAPARRARTGRIGLRVIDGAVVTPPFDDGTRIGIDGGVLVVADRRVPIDTVRQAAMALGVDVTADPGVGRDLPPFTPDAPIVIDSAAFAVLVAWYSLGGNVLGAIDAADVSEPQLWPEHFDLATVITTGRGAQVNVGFSAGDGYSAEPYVYVGPHAFDGGDSGFWNAPFGAARGYAALASSDDPRAMARAFIAEGLTLL